MLVNSTPHCPFYPFVAESNCGASIIKVKNSKSIATVTDLIFLPYGFASTWQLCSVFLCKCVNLIISLSPSPPISSPTMYLLSMETVSLTEGPGENSISALPDDKMTPFFWWLWRALPNSLINNMVSHNPWIMGYLPHFFFSQPLVSCIWMKALRTKDNAVHGEMWNIYPLFIYFGNFIFLQG